ncbi:DUF6011 domain-containing protein [Nonomuraea terrae]|uniref:DUF6011 domain-containing protein n=1 Tax=Nonomuraea terrae TaxID=2530383 RepID=UPI0037A924C8
MTACACACSRRSDGRTPSRPLDGPDAREHVSRCAACKHRLRTPESQLLGLGPDCASKLGITARRPVRITGVEKWRDCEGQIDLLEETNG